jgi:hypothetical protein
VISRPKGVREREAFTDDDFMLSSRFNKTATAEIELVEPRLPLLREANHSADRWRDLAWDVKSHIMDETNLHLRDAGNGA